MHGFDTQLRLLFATDLSDRSDRAFDRALMLARNNRAHLIVLNVIDEALPADIREGLSKQAHDFIQDQMTSAKISGQAEVEIRIVRGRDYQTIIDQARDGDVHLIVLGIHRADTLIDTFVGKTMDRVLSYGDRPVLVVKSKPRRAYAKILVGTDFSNASRRALQFAIRLFPTAEFTLLHVHGNPIAKSLRQNREFEKLWERRRIALTEMADGVLEHMRKEIGTGDFTIIPALHEGMPLMAIERHIETYHPDLVVVGTHGRSRFKEAFIGSFAKAVLSIARCDVLAVRPANED